MEILLDNLKVEFEQEKIWNLEKVYDKPFGFTKADLWLNYGIPLHSHDYFLPFSWIYHWILDFV